ncbi:MAG: fructosamine kinase family protein [Cyclobacteriaceae bacterium]|nr:fructosamine kinase family protein [Cyclobacteriaceae bacterium]
MKQPGGHVFFEKVLFETLGRPVAVRDAVFRSGGCINNALQVKTNEGDYFIKWQSGIAGDMFEKEAAGLTLLKQAKCMNIPEVLAYGLMDGKHYLVLEYIEAGKKKNNYWEDFGSALASLHRQHAQPQFGLNHDNYIGKLPQSNTPDTNWVSFFINNRLEPQLRLAIENGLVSHRFIDRYRSLYDHLADLLPLEQPALLHGDLWSGNVMTGGNGQVCLIDPAVYYGHREIELAFTRMFGGFAIEFYESYQQAYPLETGFDQRVPIYNIYPHMVHVNLFGTSYLSGVEPVLQKYVD